MSLITVGTVAFDAIETPFGSSGRVVGGAASYIALAASHFVPQQHLVSVVGGDFPQDFLDGLEARGVELGGLERRAGERSFFLVRQIPLGHEQPGYARDGTQCAGGL